MRFHFVCNADEIPLDTQAMVLRSTDPKMEKLHSQFSKTWSLGQLLGKTSVLASTCMTIHIGNYFLTTSNRLRNMLSVVIRPKKVARLMYHSEINCLGVEIPTTFCLHTSSRSWWPSPTNSVPIIGDPRLRVSSCTGEARS